MKTVRVEFPDDRDSFLHWFLIHLLTGEHTQEIIDKMDREPVDEHFSRAYAKMTVTMNGHDVSDQLVSAIERLGTEFERIVGKKAQELVDEKVSAKLRRFEEIMADIEGETRRKFKGELGIEVEDPEEW
jgi:hypothetical protein